MKVTQIGGIAGPDSIAGGVWSVARGQSEGLRSQGHDVDLVGLWMAEKVPSLAPSERVHLFRGYAPFPGARMRLTYVRALPSRLRALFSAADVVHIHLSRDYFSSYAFWLATRMGKPIFVQAHGMITPASKPANHLFDALFKRMYLRADATWLALTEREEFNLAAFGVREAAIRRIVNGVHDESYPRKPGSATRFSFISRLAQRKQPHVFVQACLNLLNDHKFQVVLAGPDQGMEAELRRMVAASSYQDAFTFSGPLSRESVWAELASTSAVVLPSKGEVAPMIAIEAAAAEAPLILTADCGISQILDQSQAALVVPPTVSGVESALRTILRDEIDLESLTARARSVYRDTWSVGRMTDSLVALYEEKI